MRLPTIVLFALSCSSLVLACSPHDDASSAEQASTPSGQGDGTSEDGSPRPNGEGDAGPASDDKGGGGGGGGKSSSDAGPNPSAFTISGTASVTCTFQSFAEPHVARCKLVPKSSSVTPSIPGDFTGFFVAASTTGSELGVQPGLVVTAPSNGGCLQHLSVTSAGFDFSVASKTPTGQPCNLPADGFTTSGFGPKLAAVIPHALYYPKGTQSGIGFDATLTLSFDVVAGP